MKKQERMLKDLGEVLGAFSLIIEICKAADNPNMGNGANPLLYPRCQKILPSVTQAISAISKTGKYRVESVIIEVKPGIEKIAES
jgi:hypothetical protein